MGISIAGIVAGKPEHFKHNYLEPMMAGFHVPVMEFSLRNTNEVITLAGLNSNNANKTATIRGPIETSPSSSLPPHLMSGVQCKQIKVKNDDAELSKAVEGGCQVMMQRTTSSGFPVLLDKSSVSTSIAVAVVQRVVGPALLYTRDGLEKNEATSAEVENWLKRWKRGEERRALVTDENISRGWEAPAVMVVGKSDTENLVMRTCGFCFLIKIE